MMCIADCGNRANADQSLKLGRDRSGFVCSGESRSNWIDSFRRSTFIPNFLIFIGSQSHSSEDKSKKGIYSFARAGK
jgi:hypothetical protein